MSSLIERAGRFASGRTARVAIYTVAVLYLIAAVIFAREVTAPADPPSLLPAFVLWGCAALAAFSALALGFGRGAGVLVFGVLWVVQFGVLAVMSGSDVFGWRMAGLHLGAALMLGLIALAVAGGDEQPGAPPP